MQKSPWIAIVSFLSLVAILLIAAAESAPDHRASEAPVSLAGITLAGMNGAPSPAVYASHQGERQAYRDMMARLPSTGARDDGARTEDVPDEALTQVVRRVCVTCHNDQLRTGNLTLEGFDVAETGERAETAEKMITKLRLEMMPPPGIPRPGGDTLVALVETLERKVDEAVAADPNPGMRLPQRLNREEYERTIHNMFGVEVDASAYLPPETISDNFDNISDVQSISASLLEGYMRMAAHVARVAVGDPDATPTQSTYRARITRSQLDRVEGAPYGSRGGISAVHNFPADGEYTFRFEFHRTPTGSLYGQTARNEKLELSINGERVAVIDIDPFIHEQDPDGLTVATDPIVVRSGPHRVTAAFIPTFDGPVNDVLAPIGQTMADAQIGLALGVTTVPHMRELRVSGPFNPTGVSETPSREKIFSCRPTSLAEGDVCAEEIIREIGAEAYRRPLMDRDVEGLLSLYREGVEEGEGGFEAGIRTALQGVLSSPHFVFRYDTQPRDAAPGDLYPISDESLATRLSYFIWGQPPDSELVELASEGRLSDAEVLEEQVWRMMDDPRADALGERFAAQWLRLPRLEVIHPDPRMYPEFDDRLREHMRAETELFFNHLVREDRSFLELFTADYTFVNGRLARHYGMSGVSGSDFRRVEVTDERRRGLGLLGHASVLTLSSHANRTSPVDRGLWVMEVLMGTEPPPPPPVPSLEETASESAEDGRALTVRERLAIHRDNPTCNACHQFIDPLGLPLENFDVTGLWRLRDSGNPIDSRGELWDGTDLVTPQDLRDALLSLEVQVVRNFTENMMRYALGRRVQHYDRPMIREIANAAAENDYRMSSFILGIVMSDQFRLRRAEQMADDDL